MLWDYCSLPQLPYGDELVETELFERGRRGIHAWFSHPHTFVLMVTSMPPRKKNSFYLGKKYSNTRGYDQRGWTIVERRLSSLVKSQGRLWDLSRYDPEALGETKLANFDGLQRQLKAARPPPMSPERLSVQLRAAVVSGDVSFSVPTDIDVVLQLYERGFVSAITDFAYNHTSMASKPGELFYRNLKWGAEEAEEITEALKFASERCSPLGDRIFHIFDGNHFSAEDKERMRAACEGSKLKVEN